jgi:hypothetical protein
MVCTDITPTNKDLDEELYIHLSELKSILGFTYLDLLLNIEFRKMGFSSFHPDFCTYFSSRITGFVS